MINEPKKEFTYEEFEKVIVELKAADIKYFIFGGFALDAINCSREKHEDLDMVILEKDKEKIRLLFKRLGYTLYLHGRKHDYRKSSHKIDIIFMKDLGDYYEIKGNVCKDKVSKEAFFTENKVKTGNLEFVIMPYEWFCLYEGKHYNKEKRKIVDKTIQKIKPFCKALKILSLEEIPKPDNMEEIEI